MDKSLKKMVCHSGCLCCACIHKNENINKKFYDTVMCYQEKDKCVKITPTEYILKEII